METPSLSLQLRAKRSEMMVSELEEVALRLFDQARLSPMSRSKRSPQKRGSPYAPSTVTLPPRKTCCSYGSSRRSEVLREALAGCPDDEPPLRSLRLALVEEFSAVNPIVLRRWIAVVADNPNVMRGVVGARKSTEDPHPVIAEFFGARLGLPRRRVGSHDARRSRTRCRAGSAHPVVRPRRRLGNHDVREPRGSREKHQHRPQNLGGGWRCWEVQRGKQPGSAEVEVPLGIRPIARLHTRWQQPRRAQVRDLR